MGTLAAELRDLYRCGNAILPRIAEAHASANRALDHASAPTEFGGGSTEGLAFTAALGRFGTQYKRLRSYVQNAVGETADNLDSVGAALVKISEHYAYHDEATAASFPDIKDDFDDKIADDRDSPYYSDPPDRTDTVTDDLPAEETD